MGGTTGALVRIIPAGGVYTVFFIPVEGGFAGMPDRFDLTATELSAMFQRMLQLSASQGPAKGTRAIRGDFPIQVSLWLAVEDGLIPFRVSGSCLSSYGGFDQTLSQVYNKYGNFKTLRDSSHNVQP